jgi:GTPase SAR1 family protein
MRLESHNHIDLEAFAHVNASMAKNPGLAHALLELLEKVGDDVTKIKALCLHWFKNNQTPQVTGATASQVPVQTGAHEIVLQGSQAIEMYIEVDGQIVRTVLLEDSFYKSRCQQYLYADKLHGRPETREENSTVAKTLLKKEEQGNLNPADAILLNIYRHRYIRDSQGGLDLYGRHIRDNYNQNGNVNPHVGALFVLPLDASHNCPFMR